MASCGPAPRSALTREQNLSVLFSGWRAVLCRSPECPLGGVGTRQVLTMGPEVFQPASVRPSVPALARAWAGEAGGPGGGRSCMRKMQGRPRGHLRASQHSPRSSRDSFRDARRAPALGLPLAVAVGGVGGPWPRPCPGAAGRPGLGGIPSRGFALSRGSERPQGVPWQRGSGTGAWREGSAWLSFSPWTQTSLPPEGLGRSGSGRARSA